MKNKKLIVFLILIILVGAAGVVVGATASLWTEASALTGIAPQAQTYDYNAWQKYVTWQFVSGNDGDIEITGFENYLDEYFIVPKSVDGHKVVKVKNTIFADDTLKKMPTTVVIPAGVTIEASAFSGLTNLKELIFDGLPNDTTTITRVGAFAFSGCTSLRSIVYNTGTMAGLNINTNVSFDADAFLGCTSVNKITKSTGTITYVSSSGNKTVKDNWSDFLWTFGWSESEISNPY